MKNALVSGLLTHEIRKLIVQRNPDKDGEYMVSEVPHESKTSAWAWWDEYKKGLGIVEPTKLEVVAGDDKPSKNGKVSRAAK